MNRIRVFAAVLAGVLSVCCFAEAGEDRWSKLADEVFRNFGADDGLPHPVVAALAQDGDGFLWIGTQGGLARWDGYRFRPYLADPSIPGALPNNYIQLLTSDRQGRLWVGTASGQLARYDREKDNFTVFQTGDDGKGHAAVDAFAEDREGGIWVGTERGLDHWDKSGTIHHLHHVDNDGKSPPGDRIYSLLTDRAGSLWLGTDRGLARYDSETGLFNSFDLPDSDAPRPDVHSLFEDSAGRLWVGTRGHGAFVIDRERLSARAIRQEGAASLNDEWFMSMAEVQDEIWMGSPSNGIAAVDLGSFKVRWITHDPARQSSLPHVQVRSILRDRSGVVWVGGPGGLGRYEAQSAVSTLFSATTRPNGISDRDILSVLEVSPNRLWLGTVTGGVNILDPAEGRVGMLPTPFVLGMESNGTHVYLTSRGLFRADIDGGNLTQIHLPGPNASANVRTLLIDGDTLWCGGETSGLFKVDLQSEEAELLVSRDQLTDQWPTSLLLGPDDGLWVGTRNGLNLVDRKTGKVEFIYADPKDAGALSVGFVSSLVTDRRGRLWVGTLGGGINIMEGRDGQGRPRFRHLGKAQGLPVDNIGKLLMDGKGRIWASTSDGVAIIDEDTLAVRALHRAEGVAISGYWTGSGTLTAAGEILFGGQGGVTIIHPDNFKPWTYRPPVVVTDLRIGGKPVPAAAGVLTIPAEANSLAVEFASLDLSAPERNRYAYRLEGYDQDWVDTDWTRRLASYTNLPPGDYRLHLRGSNRDGEWSEKTLILPIRVLPLWHQTLWFKLAVTAGSLLAVLLLLRWRTAYLQRRQKVLEREVAEQTAELRNYNETLGLLGVIGQEITATLDTEAVFETLHRHLGSLLDAPVLTIFLLEEGRSELVRRFGIAFGEPLPHTRIPLGHSSSNVAMAAREQRLLLVELGPEDEDPNHVPGTPKTLSRLFAPLIVHRRLLGVMSVQTGTPHAYGERDRTIFSALCSYVSIAIDNTHAYDRVSHSLEQVAGLLDNSGEGFLSFGADMIVEPECSRACETMLGASPVGRRVDEVLFPDDEPSRDLLRSTIDRVLSVADLRRGEVMLSLLPSIIEHGESVLKVDYKQLESGRFMVVLDDITEERRLAEAVDEEHRRLSMIVWAVTENRAFLDAVDQFLSFLSQDPRSLVELYREVHTFKGVLAQFSFQETPRALHRLERDLSELAERGDAATADALAAVMRAADLEAALQADLAEIEGALGEDFLHRGERVVLSVEQAAGLRDAAERILSGEQLNAASAEFRTLLEGLLNLRKVTLKDALAGYERVVAQAAARLEKEVAPVEVAGGGDVWVDPDIHGPFLRSLVHVFRNAVAHGIEEPDIRIAAGKGPAGHIRCTAESIGGEIRLAISDDGAGIDIAALRARTAMTGGSEEELLDRIFEDGVSTREEADELAGHGVGLAAVRAEITKLGGRVSVRSTPGQGAEFSFVLPVN